MTVTLLPYTLIIFPSDDEPFERLGEHLSAYRLKFTASFDDSAFKNDLPDALIAPVNKHSLALYQSIQSSAELPERPLLVLLVEKPTSNLPADLALPAAWLDQTLPAALQQRRDNLMLRKQIDEAAFAAAAQLEQQKRTSEEIDLLKNAIVRTVSHELKTPLLHVKSAVSMLKDDREEDRLKLIGYAMEATARLEAVVKNVTQLADSLDIELEATQVSEAVAQAVRNLRRSWEHKDQIARIQVVMEPELPPVLADKQALGVVLQLLIDNGLKFSRKDVEVSAQRCDNESRVRIAVRDFGIGIAPDKLEKIFDPFYQVDNSDTRRFGGIGVGLSIVRLILERHHAPIQVESEIEKGSRFSFTLPHAR